MIAGVLLAAGGGSRFGSHKLLHPLDDGAPIAGHSARHLITALPMSIAVIRPGDAELSVLLRGLGLTIVECAKAAQGVGASIACGISALPAVDGWVIALADMPWIQPRTIYAVAQHLRLGAEIAAPIYKEQRGHPVGFSATFKKNLSALHSDIGARAVLETAGERLLLINTHDAGVLRDVDVPADARRDFCKK